MKPAALIIALLAVLDAGSSSPTPTPTRPAPMEDAAVSACRADVAHANQDAHNVKALDFAIHDCPSLAALKAAMAAAPGYLDPSMRVDVFVWNRCNDPSATFAGLTSPICDEVPAFQ
jgi:hypothetical protein